MFALLFLFALFHTSKSLDYQPCSHDWECDNVSIEYKFVKCVNNKCQCSILGFSGNATINNKCRCNYPRTVEWVGNPKVPYCISYNEAIAAQKEQEKADQQMSYVYQYINSLIYPEPVYIINAYKANLTHPDHPIFDLFSADSRGRVVPMGIFSGKDGYVEYLYGSVCDNITRVDQVWIVKLISLGNIVYANYIIHFNVYNASNLTQRLNHYNLTEDGPITFRIDPDGVNRIYLSDFVIRYLGSAVYAASGGRGLGFGTEAYANAICTTYFTPQAEGGAGCTEEMDPLGYYGNFTNCVNYFVNVYIPGTMDNLWFTKGGNSTACRYYHMKLAKINPHHHCPHCGSTGGGRCIDHVYSSYFNEEY